MIPARATRVEQQTSPEINQQIYQSIQRNVQCYAHADRETVNRRLTELNHEWDTERVLELNAGSISLAAILLGVTKHRAWFLLPGIVGAFLAQHAIQGWCPPLPLLRRLGFRTTEEIEQERYALKLLRGDFDDYLGQGEESRNTSLIMRSIQK